MNQSSGHDILFVAKRESQPEIKQALGWPMICHVKTLVGGGIVSV